MDGKDGRPVRELPLLREDGPLARIVLPVPSGEGYILLRMEDTPLRTMAKQVTLATLVLAVFVPATMDWSEGCPVIPGGTSTVTVATALVTDPAELVTTTV